MKTRTLIETLNKISSYAYEWHMADPKRLRPHGRNENPAGTWQLSGIWYDLEFDQLLQDLDVLRVGLDDDVLSEIVTDARSTAIAHTVHAAGESHLEKYWGIGRWINPETGRNETFTFKAVRDPNHCEAIGPRYPCGAFAIVK